MRRTIYPYPTLASDLELKIAAVQVDGKAINTDFLLVSERVLNIYDAAISEWERLSFNVEVQCHAPTLAAYEAEHGQVVLTLVASCRPTNVRQRIELKRSEKDPSRWTGVVELDRDNFREKVALHGILTGNVESLPHRPVAFTDPWVIYFDPTDSFRVAGALRVVWVDFKSADAPPIAKQFSDSAYVVDLDKPMPEILLNSSFDGLEPLLRDSKDRSNVEKALHDTTRMAIARSVWMTLVNDSMAAIREGEDGDETEWPERSWQTEVLKRILPEIDATKSEAELLHLAADDWRKQSGSAVFQSRAEAVIGELTNANKTLRKAMQKLIREGVVT
jgi:hypothetical protein